MSLNLVLFALVLIVSGGGVVRARSGRSFDGLVCGVLLLGFLFFPDVVGYVAAALWGALVGIPGLLAGRLIKAVIFGDTVRARRVAPLVTYLHPERLWRRRGALVWGIEALRRGEREHGERLLADLQRAAPEFAPWIDVERAVLTGDFRTALRRAEDALGGGLREIPIFLRHFQALGEVGAIEQLDRECAALEGRLWGDAEAMVRLVLGAFHGEVQFVRYLLAGPCGAMPVERQQLWLATAHQGAGDTAAAGAILEATIRSQVPGIAGEARRRRDAALGVPGPVPPALAAVVGTAIVDEARFGDRDIAAGPVTRTLLWLIIGVFILETIAGERTLFLLGAFSAGAVVEGGQWWRIMSALFLHAGIAHVAFNALALRSLAPFVERWFGPGRFLAIYFGAGAGGLALMAWAIVTVPLEDHIVIGASGAIMGLVGATGALLSRGARTEGSIVARERLRAVGAIIGLQIVFDLLVPQTSGAAHLVGAGLGYLIARALLR